jgi:peptidoglycan hydrolase-like protein with peptidoglycan-binding domain
VELIQEALVSWGFLADERPQGVYRQDGYYGQKTADAVRLAQLFSGYP